MSRLVFSFLPAKNGNYFHKVKKLMNGFRAENTGQSITVLEKAGRALQRKCDQYSEK